MDALPSWFYWAFLSALFAALTAILAKLGLDSIDADLATLIRTVVILIVLSLFVGMTGKWTGLSSVDSRTMTFLVLSGLATGASWVCYFRALKIGEASQVAPVDKLSLVMVALFAFAFLHERPHSKDWLGLTLVSIGVVMLAIKR